MNFNAVNVIMLGIGAILIYSAIKDRSPKEAIADAFSQTASGKNSSAKSNVPAKASNGAASDPNAPHPAPVLGHPVATSN